MSTAATMSPSVVSYKLIINPTLPKDVAAIALKQGENPATVCSFLEELRNMIYGSCIKYAFHIHACSTCNMRTFNLNLRAR